MLTNRKILILAFNKSIQTYLTGLLADCPLVNVSTIHSFSLGILRKVVNARPNIGGLARNPGGASDYGFKKRVLARACVPPEKRRLLLRPLLDLISWVQSTLCQSLEEMKKFLEYKMVMDEADQNLVIEYLNTILDASYKSINAPDFDDMVWLVAEKLKINDIPHSDYDWILVDEAQDLTNAQIEVLYRIIHACEKSPRVVICGDPNQSIYGFVGVYDAMNRIKSKLEELQTKIQVK